jgi:hypothetical protein
VTSVLFNGKKNLVQNSWDEVKTRTYISIVRDWEPETDIADREYFNLLNILTDNKYKYDQSVENKITLIDLIGWVIFQPAPFKEAPLPKVLQFKDAIIDIPQNIKELSIGQAIHMRREIERLKILDACIPIAIGIYLQPLIDKGKFNLSRAKEIAKEVEEMPITLTYPIGFFLLRLAMRLGPSTPGIWHRVSSSLKRILRRQ